MSKGPPVQNPAQQYCCHNKAHLHGSMAMAVCLCVRRHKRPCMLVMACQTKRVVTMCRCHGAAEPDYVLAQPACSCAVIVLCCLWILVELVIIQVCKCYSFSKSPHCLQGSSYAHMLFSAVHHAHPCMVFLLCVMPVCLDSFQLCLYVLKCLCACLCTLRNICGDLAIYI